MGIGRLIRKLLGWLSFGSRERPRRNASPSPPQSSPRHRQPLEDEAHFARPNEPWSLPQSSLRIGELIQPETAACHPLWVAFSARGMDQARLGRLGDKRYWESLLHADLAACAGRTEEEADLDAYCMAILMPGVQVQATPIPPVPAEMLEGAVGYGEAMLETAEKSDYALYLVVNEPNAQPARIGWTPAHHLARIVAHETAGIICDLHSGRWWSYEQWCQLDAYPSGHEIATSLVVRGVQQSSGLIDLQTVGMLHFGLPDIEVIQVPIIHTDDITHLMRVVCHRLAVDALGDRPTARVGEDMTIRFQDVLESYGTPADQAAESPCSTQVRVEPGDSQVLAGNNRLLRLHPGGNLPSGIEGLLACLKALFAVEDNVVGTFATEEMEAAHRQALTTLPAEKQRFRRGLRPKETFLVKVGFVGSDGSQEYMWIEVHQWTDAVNPAESQLQGVLISEPRHVEGLRIGQQLTVEERRVYDWLRITPAGRRLGDFIGAVLNRREDQEW